MAYTEKQEETITVLPTGALQVRVDTVVFRDGVEIARLPNRETYSSDVDPDTISSDRVRAIASLVSTRSANFLKKR